MELWHATTKQASKKILLEGLRGGNGLHGGMAIEYSETPTLYITENSIPDEDLERYGGMLLLITISKRKLKEMGFHEICGTWIKEGDGILLDAEYISNPAKNYKHGCCSPCRWCEAYCEDYDDCCYYK